jgi:hypothetical protein
LWFRWQRKPARVYASIKGKDMSEKVLRPTQF